MVGFFELCVVEGEKVVLAHYTMGATTFNKY